MKVVIIGGHFSPALAVIEKLKNDEVFYIGRKYNFEGDKAVSLEYEEIQKLNIPFFPINTARLQRRFTRYTFFSLAKFPLGFFQAFKILKRINPDVVLGFGGYVQMPVIAAAKFLGTPVVIHEQTLEAGVANKIASKSAKKICISWSSSENYFPKGKTILTGNPIKQEIIDVKNARRVKNSTPTIYITGGSGGSHAVNILVEKTLGDLLKNYVVLHQTGDSKRFRDFEKLEKRKEELSNDISKNYIVKKFLTSKEAAESLSKADLVVGRSGINTVSELIYLEKPALLIPLPFSQKNEQLKNAEFIKKLGLAEIIQQSLLTEDLFLSAISKMVKNLSSYKIKNPTVSENAADKIVEVLKNVSKKKTA